MKNRFDGVDKPLKLRSKVTNGRRLWAIGGDGNSVWTRRWKDLNGSHAVDMGGLDYLSEAQKSLIRRASTIEVELERQEAKLSVGEEINLAVYSRIAQRLHSILAGLGLKRVARPVNAIESLDAISTYLSEQKPPETAE